MWIFNVFIFIDAIWDRKATLAAISLYEVNIEMIDHVKKRKIMGGNKDWIIGAWNKGIIFKKAIIQYTFLYSL